MAVSFEGFPRVLERSALRPGRWFIAAEGLRPILCFATDVMEGEHQLALTLGASRPELLDVEAAPMAALAGPFATVEDELVFAPGLDAQKPVLAAPARRTFRTGALLRLRNGDLGMAFAAPVSGERAIVSLVSGLRIESYDLVFERWSLSLRRGGAQTLIGVVRPTHAALAEERRA